MSREDQKQSVIEGPQESEAMADHGAKGEEIYIEHVPGNATELHGDGNLVMEYQISEGITRETILAFVAICGQLNAYEMSLLIPAASLSYINADLGPSPSYAWISITWALGAAILVSVAGRLADIFGRRYFMLTGALIAFIGTIIGATGQSITQMIVSGVFFGIGAGFQEMGYACIMEFVPNKHRLAFIGAYGCSSILAVFSPLITYTFIAHTRISWRGAYWYMCAWHGCAGIFLFFFYKPPTFQTKHRRDGKTKWQLICELDYVGLFLFTAGCTLFLVGINFGGGQHPWKSAAVIAPIVTGTLSVVAAIVWDFTADLKYPLLPPKLLSDFRGYVVLVVIAFLAGMLYYSMQVVWPRESGLLYVSEDDPIMRGVYANIPPWGNLIAVLSVWLVCSRLNHERWQLVFFVCVQTLLVGTLASVTIGQKGKVIALIFLLNVFTNQPLYVLMSMVSLNLDDQQDIGVGLGVMSTFRLLGGAVATAIYTAVARSEFSTKFPAELVKAVKPTGFDMANIEQLAEAAVLGTKQAFAAVPGINAVVIQASESAVQLAYTKAYDIVYLVGLAFGGLGIISALLSKSSDRALKNTHKAVLLENEKIRLGGEDIEKSPPSNAALTAMPA